MFLFVHIAGLNVPAQLTPSRSYRVPKDHNIRMIMFVGFYNQIVLASLKLREARDVWLDLAI
jgi:hypothetical protein